MSDKVAAAVIGAAATIAAAMITSGSCDSFRICIGRGCDQPANSAPAPSNPSVSVSAPQPPVVSQAPQQNVPSTSSASAPVVAAPSASQSSPLPPSSSALPSCPALQDASKLAKVVLTQQLESEPCIFVRRGATRGSLATCPADWICTWYVLDRCIVVVVEGEHERQNVENGTWRYRKAYPAGSMVHNRCALLANEREFERTRGAGLKVEPEGFSC